MIAAERALDVLAAEPTVAATVPAPEVFHLRLYVAGHSPKSITALANLERLCADQPAYRFEIEVVDLVESPELAGGHEIIAIPTLVRLVPEPVRRVIGDLSDSERVILGLHLPPENR